MILEVLVRQKLTAASSVTLLKYLSHTYSALCYKSQSFSSSQVNVRKLNGAVITSEENKADQYIYERFL